MAGDPRPPDLPEGGVTAAAAPAPVGDGATDQPVRIFGFEPAEFALAAMIGLVVFLAILSGRGDVDDFNLGVRARKQE